MTDTPLDLKELSTALEREGRPWEPSYTSITALTEEERAVRLGVPIDPGLDVARLEASTEEAAARARGARAESVGAPVSFDLRNVNGANYSTPVRDQLNCGSCVAFGVAGTLESVARFTYGTPSLPYDFSEAHLFYCHGRAAGARCGTGWFPEPALDAVRDTGITFEDYYPYTPGDQACSGLNADWPNRLAKTPSWQSLTNSPAQMKEYISKYGAITACFYVFQDFFNYGSGVYKHVTGSLAGGHCVTLIGYNDSAGYWVGKNSWGTGWGESGFFKIAYGECYIESWHNCGVQRVNVQAWLPNQKVLGLWTNEHDANIFVYGAQRGWLKLDSGTVATNQAMACELAASKALSTNVGIFENNGSVKQIYAW